MMLGPIVYPQSTVFEPSAVRNGASPLPAVTHEGSVRAVAGGQTPEAVQPPPAIVQARAVGRQRQGDRAGRSAEEAAGPGRLSEAEEAQVEELRERDREVRAHELAHSAAAGRHGGSPRYRYERGPDGRLYAVEGEVPIDVAPVPGDPEATLRKMEQVKRAALAPASPSSKDQRVAALATRRAAEARRDIAQRALESLLDGAVPDPDLGIPQGRRRASNVTPAIAERATLSANRYLEQAQTRNADRATATPGPSTERLESSGSVRPSPAVER